jgi:hypothetical protein
LVRGFFSCRYESDARTRTHSESLRETEQALLVDFARSALGVRCVLASLSSCSRKTLLELLSPKCEACTFPKCDLACNRRTSDSDKGPRRGISRAPSGKSSSAAAAADGTGGRYLAGLYRAKAANRRQWTRTYAARRAERFQPTLHGTAYFFKRVGTRLGHPFDNLVVQRFT